MEQMADIMKETVVRASLEELRDNGLIDWIEDENGDEMVFLTEKGKEMGKSLFGHSDDDTDVTLEHEALKQFYEKK
jgi:rRNA pseudouridine-1189 N-methylase Emg1 (Nep1/Mra1 family)